MLIFFSSTTFGVIVCLHTPQTKVCPLCAGAFLGTTIDIAACCMLRPLFLPGMTAGMSSVFIALRPKSVNYVPGLWVPLARPSALRSVFLALKPKYVRCVLRYPLGYNLRRHRPLPPKNLLFTQHDSQRCHMSSQPSDQSLSAVC